ncbi:hypothetical protein OHC33_010248 [Knufia fluminis]|uniref:BTB domain-containing protein n=1 Tax=Knufia fluminis TaxID=191047 RepID=A0AAN8EJS8_9EURO|nr:hypothetical protein OHC33_010248 [Knufia fluminis]
MPDVTVVLGDCRWKVHSKLLTSKSDYFTKALQEPDEEAETNTIAVQDDDPFMMGRLIQFIYEATYDLPGDCELAPQALSLAEIMQCYTNKSEDEDQEDAENRSNDETHCMVIQLADKYCVSDLVSCAVSKLTASIKQNGLADDLIWNCHAVIGEDLIGRHAALQDIFADMAACGFMDVSDDRFKAWCEKDSKFAYKLVQAMKKEKDVIQASREELLNSPPPPKRKRTKHSS